MPTDSKHPKTVALAGARAARQPRKRSAAAPGSLDYALEHPTERVVVQGPRYSVVLPRLESSGLSDGDLRALMRAMVK